MTKKELFKKAHKLTKEIKKVYSNVDYRFQFSLCLAYLKEGEVKMVKLEGSEKQIAWAESLKEGFLKMLLETKEDILKSKNTVLVYYKELQKEVESITCEKKISQVRLALDKIISTAIKNIENEVSSKKIIDIHQGLKTYGASRTDLVRKFI